MRTALIFVCLCIKTKARIIIIRLGIVNILRIKLRGFCDIQILEKNYLETLSNILKITRVIQA